MPKMPLGTSRFRQNQIEYWTGKQWNGTGLISQGGTPSLDWSSITNIPSFLDYDNVTDFSDGHGHSADQISGLDIYAKKAANETITGTWNFTSYLNTNNDAGYRIGGGSALTRSGTQIRIAASGINTGGVALYHNNVVRLKTTSTGVYITEALDVDGNIIANNPAASNSTPSGEINFRVGNVTQSSITGYRNFSSDGSLIFNTRTGGTIQEAMRIRYGGLVGIGTSNPDRQLNVVGNSKFSGEAQVTGFMKVGAAATPTEALDVAGDIKSDSFRIRTSSPNTVLENITNGDVYLRAGGTADVILADTASGRVGVGTAPSEALDVDGNIHTNGKLIFDENRFVNVEFSMVENATPQYILLCHNVANNDVSGSIQMNRTSGYYQSAKLDVIISSSNIAMQYGTLNTQQTTQSNEQYDLVTCEYGGVSYVAIRYQGAPYPSTLTAVFSGMRNTTSGDILVVATGVTNIVEWAISPFGNERNTIRGRVGINNTNPSEVLDVNGGIRVESNAAFDYALKVIHTNLDGSGILVQAGNNNDISFLNCKDQSGVQKVRWASNGHLRIGDGNPTEALDVQGAGLFRGWNTIDAPPASSTRVQGYGIHTNRAEWNITNSNTDVNARIKFCIGASNWDANSVMTLYRSGGVAQANLRQTFVSGFAGAGTRWSDDGVTTAFEVDELTVRNKMRVYELEINKIRATNGSLWVSDAMETTEINLVNNPFGNDLYNLYGLPDEEAVFVVGDIIRCQQWDRVNNSTLYFQGEVTAVGTSGDRALITVENYSNLIPFGENELTFVRVNHVSNDDRKGAIYLTSSDSGAPYIDVTFDEVPKLRLGKLDGISGQSGYGLWGGDANGDEALVLSTDGYARIAGWNFDNKAIYNTFGGTTVAMGDGVGGAWSTSVKGFSTGEDGTNRIFMGTNGGTDGYTIAAVQNGNYVFNLGSWDFGKGVNQIAGWEFDYEKLQKSVSGNTLEMKATSSEASITGSVGVNEIFKLSTTDGNSQIAGWKFSDQSLYSGASPTSTFNVTLYRSSSSSAGVRVYGSNIGNLTELYSRGSGDWGLRGLDVTASEIFHLGSTNQIANWNFDVDALYTGTKQPNNDYTSNGITLHKDGAIRTPNFRVDTTGDTFIRGEITAERILLTPLVIVDTPTGTSPSITLPGNSSQYNIEANISGVITDYTINLPELILGETISIYMDITSWGGTNPDFRLFRFNAVSGETLKTFSINDLPSKNPFIIEISYVTDRYAPGLDRYNYVSKVTTYSLGLQ